MHFEQFELNDLIVGLFAIASPVILAIAIISFVFRRSPWVVPLWVFAVCPVLVLFGALISLNSFKTGGYGPDGGFLAMDREPIAIVTFLEVILGILLLCCCPPKSNWTPKSVVACIPTSVLSISLMLVGFRFATIPPSDPTSATKFAADYLHSTNSGMTDGFRKHAFISLVKDSNTPQEVLTAIGTALSNQSPLWSTLARNPSIPASVIEARGSDPLIAVVFAENHVLPPKFLVTLSENPGSGFRTIAARCPNTPKDTLEKLAQDKDDIVRMFARENLSGTLGQFAY
jgi:hypothetical protein